MMKQPDWIGRIPQIRAELSCVTTQFIDRRQLERLFGVSASQGRRLITRMGPMLHGNSLVVDAEDILKMLSDIERDQEVHDLRLRLTEKSVSNRDRIQRSLGAAPFAHAFDDRPSSCAQSVAANAHTILEQDRQQRVR